MDKHSQRHLDAILFIVWPGSPGVFFGLPMSMRKRDLVTIGLVVVLAVIAFSTGFLLNDFLRARNGGSLIFEGKDEFGIFWEAWNKIESSFIGTLPADQEMTYGAIRGAIEVLDDPYTLFIEPEARNLEKDSLRGNFGGVGAVIERRDDGKIYLSPIEGNPAEAAGILDGDILIAVDGKELSEEMTVQDIAEIVRGEEGTEVTLTVIHPGESEAVNISVTRAVILLPSVSSRVLEEAPDIGYLRLSRFSGESSGEIAEVLADFDEQGLKKVILDIRQNGGGLLDAAVDVANLFLDEGPIVYQVRRGEEEKVFNADDEIMARDVELVILIDSGTASASEIVAGALKDRGRATLIGSTTFGKGSVQLVYDLSDGSSVHVTSARWYTPNRLQIDQHGLEPDIPVEISEADHASGHDVVLDSAIDFLSRVAEK